MTQIGGLVWLVALLFRRRLIAFGLLYAVAFGAVHITAPMAGRVALPCFGAPLKMQSVFYCAALRNFVTPDLASVATDAAKAVDAAYPDTVTLALDGGFPFVTGFPLLPHLSHDDGRKLDFAFYYADQGGYVRGKTPSPVGYWGYENGPTDCPATWRDLRWDMTALQSLWPDLTLDPARTKSLIATLLADPRTEKILLEPHLARSLNLSHPKLRFQGCRAARHDDHLHLQISR